MVIYMECTVSLLRSKDLISDKEVQEMGSRVKQTEAGVNYVIEVL